MKITVDSGLKMTFAEQQMRFEATGMFRLNGNKINTIDCRSERFLQLLK